MSEDLYVLRCEDHDPRPRERGASVQKRQARVTVKYNRKELQKRLNVEKWIEDTLETLYIGAEDEMPEEVDIDGLLVLHSDQERAQKLQEVLHTCKNSTQSFITELLEKLHGVHKQEELQNEGLGHPCLHGYPHHHGSAHHHGDHHQHRTHQTL
ncbi:protein phosphatase 1, regulatory (inhibitor) subunit 14Aa isoform X2 [Brachyhypopomus gauderio]|uniref:protein phosphatase 1, regulatory (inhibitor) subunit 14Aa isoform X2 n=1 Tax=Brachyhypopomus gauderio TaxID=698409 RepID=UPI004042A757